VRIGEFCFFISLQNNRSRTLYELLTVKWLAQFGTVSIEESGQGIPKFRIRPRQPVHPHGTLSKKCPSQLPWNDLARRFSEIGFPVPCRVPSSSTSVPQQAVYCPLSLCPIHYLHIFGRLTVIVARLPVLFGRIRLAKP
jgi:hypothetical protein